MPKSGPNPDKCALRVRTLGMGSVAMFVKSLLTTKVGDGTRTRDLPDHKPIPRENLDPDWDWPNYLEPRKTPSLSRISYEREGKWEVPAFPRFPIHSPSDVRQVCAPTDELGACSECGGTTVRLPDGGWKCPKCGVIF